MQQATMPDTSIQAMNNNLHAITSLRTRVLNSVQWANGTSEEIAARIGEDDYDVRRALSALQSSGKVTPLVGNEGAIVTRPNSKNNMCQVWRATAEGEKAQSNKKELSLYYRPYGFGYAEAKQVDPYAEPVSAMVKLYSKGKVIAQYEGKETEDFVQGAMQAMLTGLGYELTTLNANRGE